MSQSFSRIPHLARAIAEKRRSRSCFDQFANQKYQKYQAANKPPSAARTFTSSQASRQQRPPPAATGLSSSTYVPKHAGQPFRRLPSHGIPYPSDEDASKDTSWRDSVYRYGTLTFFVAAGAYIFFAYQSYRVSVQKYNERPEHLKLKQNADVSNRWKDNTRNFDHEVESQERVLLMSWKRKRLIREAYGDVLEVSVGTGRNMELYDTRPYSAVENSSYGRSRRHMITSLTFNDQSEVMVENAKRKWELRQAQRRKEDKFTGDVSFVVGDAGQQGVIHRPAGGYDTIVQSMGICSMADPVGFLRHLGRLVRQPGEAVLNQSPHTFRKEEDDGKGGRIFLLEHGRGYGWFRWLNGYLDSTAPIHAERYGCWYNKDIGDVVKESGLVVERMKRYSFGTVWEVVLRPAPMPLPGEDENIIQTVQDIKDLVAAKKTAEQKGWLSGWWT